MENDWLRVFLGWIGGIPTGLVANWLFQKYLSWRKSKAEYFTTTLSGDVMEFEGRVKTTASMKDVAASVLRKGLASRPRSTEDETGRF